MAFCPDFSRVYFFFKKKIIPLDDFYYEKSFDP